MADRAVRARTRAARNSERRAERTTQCRGGAAMGARRAGARARHRRRGRLGRVESSGTRRLSGACQRAGCEHDRSLPRRATGRARQTSGGAQRRPSARDVSRGRAVPRPVVDVVRTSYRGRAARAMKHPTLQCGAVAMTRRISIVWLLMFAASAAVASADRFVQKLALPDGQAVVVAEGDLEARSIGTYTVRLYSSDDTTRYLSGVIAVRDGSIESIRLADLDGRGEQLVVIVRSAGSGG